MMGREIGKKIHHSSGAWSPVWMRIGPNKTPVLFTCACLPASTRLAMGSTFTVTCELCGAECNGSATFPPLPPVRANCAVPYLQWDHDVFATRTDRVLL